MLLDITMILETSPATEIIPLFRCNGRDEIESLFLFGPKILLHRYWKLMDILFPSNPLQRLAVLPYANISKNQYIWL